MGPAGRNVVAVAVCLACVSGFGFYSLTIYAAYLARRFPLGVVSAGSALFLLTAGVAGTLVGSLISRHDVRRIMLCGTVLMSSGLLLLGQARIAPALYGACFLIGLGQACLGIVPGLSLVTSWFEPPRRSTALTLAITGWSVGGVLIAPLVTLALQHADFPAVAAASAVALALVCLACTASVTPYGGQRSPGDGEQAGLTRAEAVRTAQFWQVTASQLCIALAQVGSLTHLFAAIASRQDGTFAGRAVSAVAAGSLVGRWLGNAMLRAISGAQLYRLLMVVQGAVLASLAIEHSPGPLLASSALLGFTIGNNMLLHPLRLSELFGALDYARVLALSTLVATAGTAAGPLLLGHLREAAGTWTLPYLVAAAVSLTGAAIAGLPVSQRSSWQQDGPSERPGRRNEAIGSAGC